MTTTDLATFVRAADRLTAGGRPLAHPGNTSHSVEPPAKPQPHACEDCDGRGVFIDWDGPKVTDCDTAKGKGVVS